MGTSLAMEMVQRARDPALLYRLFADATDAEILTMFHDPEFWVRTEQTPNLEARVSILLGGRGLGKTFAGSAFAYRCARKGETRGAIVGQTAADIRDTMVEGESGILNISPPWFRPKYEPSKRRLTWPNGITAIGYPADKPDSLRGPNVGWVWGDEPAKWKANMAALDQINLILRVGKKPKLFLTGTPVPLPKLIELVDDPRVEVLTGSTFDNAANLSADAVKEFETMRETRWGQQELMGRILRDIPGAIFQKAKWVRHEVDDVVAFAREKWSRRIVAVDPAPTSDLGADESGIIVEGSRVENDLKHVCVFEDLSVRASPREWASRAIEAYVRYACDALVVEVNTGGEMVETLVSTVAREMGLTINVKPVRAREAKTKRAEPVSALAETGRVHLAGTFEKLETQLSKFSGINGRRDDRADAFCWGVHDLVFGEQFFAWF